MIRDDTLGANVKQASINFSASGDNLIVPGVAGKSIKVLQLFFVLGATDANLVFKSGSTALSGTLAMLGNGSDTLTYNQLPLTCNVGDSFFINSSAAAAIGGTIWYVQS